LKTVLPQVQHVGSALIRGASSLRPPRREWDMDCESDQGLSRFPFRLPTFAPTLPHPYRPINTRRDLRNLKGRNRTSALGTFGQLSEVNRTYRRATWSSEFDPGCVKTLGAIVATQQKNRTGGRGESFMRERHAVRINLAPELPAEWFSHGQDPFRKSGPIGSTRQSRGAWRVIRRAIEGPSKVNGVVQARR